MKSESANSATPNRSARNDSGFPQHELRDSTPLFGRASFHGFWTTDHLFEWLNRRGRVPDANDALFFRDRPRGPSGALLHILRCRILLRDCFIYRIHRGAFVVSPALALG
jgi:hypothetical protein